ncbi:tail fiber protein [Anoxybacteroides amylolyticum]|uniref:Phage tail fiber repeat family protein n=1 Tax=Anoxybacteroides amylolyticum TaxID=294699 RepID=A0A160F7U1_9BACL|nr:tail fiber protein [Anoxybacillus amylolyticus]ANB62205.1 phage tail fiber repeat family protein [Anoxybacillus amylolyticus]
MQYTGNLGLKKPEGTDVVNIDDLNQNFDVLDVEVTKLATASQAGRMSAADKAKLDGIESGAQRNTVASVNNKTGAVTLTASDVGASPTGHTHTFAEITSKPTTLAGYGITDAIPASQKGAANGVASLDSDTKVPTSQLPSASTSAPGIVQLVDSTSSTSTTQAPTANAVKQVNDAIAAHSADYVKHITAAERTAWNNAEQNAKNFVLQANPNKVKNSSFQFGLAGWVNTCSHFFVGQTLNLGSFVDHFSAVSANEWHVLDNTQRIPCWNGGVYVTISAWFYSLSQTHGNICVELYGNGNPQILGQLRADLNRDWHRKTDTFFIPSGTTEVWIKFVVGGDPQGMPSGSKAVTRIKFEYGTQATPYSQESDFFYVNDGKAQLKSAIIGKGGTVTQAGAVPTFDELNTGVNSIPTGKKWASGQVSSTSSVTIRGLAFRPSLVVVENIGGGQYSVNGRIVYWQVNDNLDQTYYSYGGIVSHTTWSIYTDGFSINLPEVASYKWIAIE